MSFKNFREIGKKYGVGGGGNWMNLQPGDNRIRIVSEFVEYGTHYNPQTKKSLACVGKEDGCSACARGEKPRVQAIGWVIDRVDSKLKILRIGWTIYKALGEYQESEDYGFNDVPPYDVTIKRSGEGQGTDYAVMPARQNTELTQAEVQMVEENAKNPIEIIAAMKAKVSKTMPEAEIPIVEDDPGSDEEDVGPVD